MTTILRTMSLIVGISVLTATASLAGSLPEGAFRGYSSLIKNDNDVMSLIIKKDAQRPDSYIAILSEYTRNALTVNVGARAEKDIFFRRTKLGKTAPLTIWVPRMFAYRIDKKGELFYSMTPLQVAANGEIENNLTARLSKLILDAKQNPMDAAVQSLDGAVITRYNSDSKEVAETITFKGIVGSTWENYVVGSFFGTTENTGNDYFSKGSNTFLTEDYEAHFFQKDVRGAFDVLESKNAPGMYTFKAKRSDNKGNEKIENRIGVFVDIVNWKHLGVDMFTTEELLLINPDSASDVGFYYERH